MQLKDPGLLRDYMELKKVSQATLARHAECSRQFIWALLNGDRKTCTKAVGERIEEALSVLPGTLFLSSVSPGERSTVMRRTTSRRKAAA